MGSDEGRVPGDFPAAAGPGQRPAGGRRDGDPLTRRTLFLHTPIAVMLGEPQELAGLDYEDDL
ncbi:hypothetical protein Ppa06_42800 [Planomonospora parontospora subsp. parontospora]|uniref:Uncharacterized protein n=2 Tax=Planomonospora parontospora TaxID=58119 RepID=A0AA37F6S2_9ACTN|nr:hypothetical protein [Planomonospora parontospora]GGK83637.1 hypothetical protein GCM10010126_48650 [Planomonospora parontospora]GII10482.1 hypothetical protein Ppa06_42800 [Planomonospora parontospora subsp. parontospora]